MKRTNLIVFTIVILLLNAGVSLVLINTIHGSAKEEGFFSQQERQNATQQLNINRQNAITDAVKAVEPAVVSVNVIKTEVVRAGINPFGWPFGDFFNVPFRREVQGIGSGIIFDKEGYILTNAHVVSGATQIKVVLPDAREFDAKITGLDEVSDVAVIKINGSDLPCARLGTSSDLIIGEWAIAVGNPYGFLMNDTKPSVAVGVISAVKRNFGQRKDGKIYKDMIQTDAAINQGNSGGPLVNINGEVIGINTFIVSESGGSIGIGFALPIDRVKKIAGELIKYHKLRPVNYGFKVQEINPELASYFNVKSGSGVMVVQLSEKSPAYKAGLRNSDVITGVNDVKILSGDDIKLAICDILAGDKVNFEILRNGKKMNIAFIAEE
ncbi:MAG TPA: trypsin-like peptidase domain-containing protein [Candidatus Cloacimonadota bacterium]|nr:trypsin-like peptidase domain-containing protein [Candidatus Cloacimonadota bacterium]